MPLVIYKVMGLRELKIISARLLMDDSSVKKPVGIVRNVEVKVASFDYSEDFMILDCEVDAHSPIILARLFLSNDWVLIDIDLEEITFKWNDKQKVLNTCMIV